MEGLIAKPSAVKYSNDSLCVVNSGTPCVSPSWYAQNASSRLAVTSAFFCRKLPAPALRGFTGTASGFLPAAIRTTFSSSFCFCGDPDPTIIISYLGFDRFDCRLFFLLCFRLERPAGDAEEEEEQEEEEQEKGGGGQQSGGGGGSAEKAQRDEL